MSIISNYPWNHPSQPAVEYLLSPFYWWGNRGDAPYVPQGRWVTTGICCFLPPELKLWVLEVLAISIIINLPSNISFWLTLAPKIWSCLPCLTFPPPVYGHHPFSFSKIPEHPHSLAKPFLLFRVTFLNLQCKYKSPRDLVMNVQVLIYYIQNRAGDFAFLTSSPAVMLLVWGPHFG